MVAWWDGLTDQQRTVLLIGGVVLILAACGALVLFALVLFQPADNPPAPPPTEAPPAGVVQAVIDAPASVQVGQVFRLDGTRSLPAQGRIEQYRWDLGNGQQASSPAVDHVYNVAGSYTVQLVVVDTSGQQATALHQIQVLEVAVPSPQTPIAVITMPATGQVGQRLAFDARNSLPGDQPIQNYVWDFGDGTRLNAAAVEHTYTRAGIFTVQLTVTDAAGRSDTAVAQITINDAPVATPLPPTTPPEAVQPTVIGN